MAEEIPGGQGLIEPIRIEVTVRRSIDDAFWHFTKQMTAWWPMQRFTFGPGRSHEVLMEPYVGGRFYERYEDGDEFTIGEVLAWEPPRRVVFTWRGRWAMPTDVTVRFTSEDMSVTRVQVEHAGWERLGDSGFERRNQYANGWPAVLAAFAASDGRAAGR
ncbi:MAG TPA: SRPBCC domain-containing protein [Candidatus Dormibacteraeota bacterium]|nr:SRPBCC domain-containing protein [Candidatus Dormibacteraeota bacterium]